MEYREELKAAYTVHRKYVTVSIWPFTCLKCQKNIVSSVNQHFQLCLSLRNAIEASSEYMHCVPEVT